MALHMAQQRQVEVALGWGTSVRGRGIPRWHARPVTIRSRLCDVRDRCGRGIVEGVTQKSSPGVAGLWVRCLHHR